MSSEYFQYDDMVRAALHGVVRQVLDDIAEHGLRGMHHYYIAFNTKHPGVMMPDYLKAKHPGEMTIVLQNQFWNLSVRDDAFSVDLSFGGKHETLFVPYDAMTGFLDPSVQFGLQFTGNEEDTQTGFGMLMDGIDGEPLIDDTDTGESMSITALAEEGDDAEVGGDNVVSLDVFRKEDSAT